MKFPKLSQIFLERQNNDLINLLLMIHFSVWQRWFIRMFDKENEVVNWRKTSDEIWLEETFSL